MYAVVAATLIMPFFVTPIQAESVTIKTFSTITSTTVATSTTTTTLPASVSTSRNKHNNQVGVFTVHDEDVMQGEELFAATDHHHGSESLARDDDEVATSPGEASPASFAIQNKMDQERKEVSVANPYNNPSLIITNTPRHDFFSVVTSSGISSRETSASNTRTSCNEETQIVFRLELQTDNHPTETSWKVVDLDTTETVAEKSQGFYTGYNTVYHEDLCISNKACVEFTIEDSYDDGICCEEGEGFYNIFYNDKLIVESGGEFGSSETTIIGDLCSSSTPSMSSSNPPSVSLQPSSYPTTSNPPSTSNMPTLAPLQEFDSIAIDEYGRRYFPRKVTSQQIESSGVYAYQPIPNCTLSSERTGCIANPKSFVDTENAPLWAGTLYQTPPVCADAKCNQGLPISRKAHSLVSNTLELVNEAVENYLTLHNRRLAGGNDFTSFIALGDVNGDGLIDVVIGNDGQPNQLLINIGNNDDSGALFSDENTISLPGGSQDTRSIALGDVNGDGLIDVVIGNVGQPNQLLINTGDDDDGALFSDANTVSLPGGSEDTMSIALGDVNGDGFIDVVV
jgi:hypothetical protein